MDIAFAFDETYAAYLPTVVESVLQSNPQADIRLWLGTTLASAHAIQADIARQVSARATVRYLMLDGKYPKLGTSTMAGLEYLGPGANLRLFLVDALPAHVTRCLYLDIDVLVNGDLNPLWRVPLGDAVLAAVADSGSPLMGSHGGPPGSPPIDPAAPYFNSGVLMINLRQWHEHRVTHRCVEYLRRNEHHLRYPDQDALNIVCHGAWLELDERWNFQGSWSGSAKSRPSPGDIRITHYAGPHKPWSPDFPAEPHRRRYATLLAHVSARITGDAPPMSAAGNAIVTRTPRTDTAAAPQTSRRHQPTSARAPITNTRASCSAATTAPDK
jgi:lipopolysaccharide biosynthesis glycosyltransferase